ncbi:hybrid sensor histidine kinase/response regulator [Parapedobacter tibetensis]|uniref:hybrid sensor histidine kinase/response regulator n=1 Tax=Parapedobacter tibetensis TaxID=2972951 RepID=UPI00214D2848|nr:two-component regulator propeller domain-containing protein [Parapedobacter tibetensis]
MRYLGIEHGLSNNSVTKIFQDSHGFMWFGTYDGLNRFDGYQFKVYKNQPGHTQSLLDNRITGIVEDGQGLIWVSTKKGASVMDGRGNFSHLEYVDINDNTIHAIDFSIHHLVSHPKGDIFAASERAGLLRVPTGSQEITHAKQTPLVQSNGVKINYNVQAIAVDYDGVLWSLVHGVGLCFYDQAAAVLRLKSPAIKSATCMTTDDLGNIWLGTDQGLYAYHIGSDRYQHYNQGNGLSGNIIASLSLGSDHTLMVCTDGGGMTKIHLPSGEFTYVKGSQHGGALTSSAVFAAYEDAESRQWIGTLRGGINIIDPHQGRFQLIRQNKSTEAIFPQDFILSFAEDGDGSLWIGTDGEGLTHWDRVNNTFKHYKHQPNNPGSLSCNNVASLLCDRNGDIWAATYGGGINRLERQKGTFKRYACFNHAANYEHRNVWKLFEDSQGSIWASTLSSGGLYRLNAERTAFELYDAAIQNVLSMMEDEEGIFWLGTFDALIRLDTKLHTVSRHYIGQAVRDIRAGKTDSLWLGTEGKGLLRIDKQSGNYRGWTESEGLPSNTVLNLLEDNSGNFWMSTFNGLAKFNPRTNQILNYHESDGLQSNQFNYNAALRLASGEFAFGGIKGFNIFFADSIRRDILLPHVVLTDLRINNKSYEHDQRFNGMGDLLTIEELTIPYQDAVLSFGFAALEFSSPGNIRYAYLLEGWDKDWNYIENQRNAHYSRLNEGNYVLRIKSTNADGTWSPFERTLSIKVLPPWWRTFWAYGIYAVLFFAGIYSYVYDVRRRTRLKYEVELAHMEVEKEKELNERKLSFFTHISHEFRTPLTLIVNPIKELLYSKDKMVDSEELTVVYRNSKRLLSLVDQLLLFRKADSEADKLRLVRLNIVELCHEVFLCFKQQAESKHLNYQFASVGEFVELYGDREKLEITLFNLLSNAIKFTPDGGKVSIQIQETPDGVEIQVEDTGCGIPEQVGDHLFAKFYRDFEGNGKGVAGFGIGLYLVKKFVDAHGGTIIYCSTPNKGSLFTLTLCKGKGQFDGQFVFEDLSERSIFLDELASDELLGGNGIGETGYDQIKKVTEVVSDLPVMLVVDDNAQIRQYIQKIFEDGYAIYEADTGEGGLEMIRTYQPDIVLSDVMMKGISGIELCARVKQDESLSHIPVILLTASSSDEIKLKGIEGGADDYITKPFDNEILVARVSNILKSRNQLQRYFYNEVTLQHNDYKISSEYSDFLQLCIQTVEQHLDNPDFTIKLLADEVGMSHSALYKRVKSISGKTANEFVRYIRLRKVAQLLISTDLNISEAAFTAGFNDMKYFREQFFKLFGVRPSEYKKKYRDTFGQHYNLNKG